MVWYTPFTRSVPVLCMLTYAVVNVLPFTIGLTFAEALLVDIPQLMGQYSIFVQLPCAILFITNEVLFFITQFKDSGKVRWRDKYLDTENTWEFCNKCHMKRPPVALHCNLCQVCVWEQDHHCVVLRNCIGRDNVKVYAEMLYTMILTCVVSIMFCVSHMIFLGDYLSEFLMLLILLAMFGLFVFFTITLRTRRKRLQEKFPQYFDK